MPMRLTQFQQILASPSLPEFVKCTVEVLRSPGEKIPGCLKLVVRITTKVIRKIHKSASDDQVGWGEGLFHVICGDICDRPRENQP